MTREAVFTAAALVLAYLIGSIPPAYIVGRLIRGIDIRSVGSHNLGAMNVFYNVGFFPGLLVLTLDVGKGALAVFVARLMGVPLWGELASGVLAVVGHGFPIFLKFRGQFSILEAIKNQRLRNLLSNVCDGRVVGNFTADGAQIRHCKSVHIVVPSQSGKTFELFCGNPKKIFKLLINKEIIDF